MAWRGITEAELGSFHRGPVTFRVLNKRLLFQNSFSGDVAIPDEVTVNDVCDAVKAFFRELEEPLLSAALQDQFIRSIMTLSRNDVKARSILQLCRVLSQRHRETLAFLMWNLKKVRPLCVHLASTIRDVCFADLGSKRCQPDEHIQHRTRHVAVGFSHG